MRTRGVVFDVDGTLVDSNYLHCLAWARAFRDHGHDVPFAAIHRRIGMGSHRLMAELVGAPDETLSAAHSARYAELHPELRALPGAAELLRRVHRRGAAVVLATSAKADEIDVLLRVIDAPDAIDAVTSSADVEQAKPEPDVFLLALSRSGLDPKASIVVGDTVWDVAAAHRAGLPCVGVASGGIARGELLAAGAVAGYDGAAHLLAELDRSPLASVLG